MCVSEVCFGGLFGSSGTYFGVFCAFRYVYCTHHFGKEHFFSDLHFRTCAHFGVFRYLPSCRWRVILNGVRTVVRNCRRVDWGMSSIECPNILENGGNAVRTRRVIKKGRSWAGSFIILEQKITYLIKKLLSEIEMEKRSIKKKKQLFLALFLHRP